METRRLSGVCRRILIIALCLLAVGACRSKPKEVTGSHSAPVPQEKADLITENPVPEPDPGTVKNQQPSYTDTSLIRRFQYAWADSLPKPPILIVVDDFGYATGSLLQGFADLPPEVAFAILPDLQYTQVAVEKANQYGHDIMIHVPMEAQGASIRPGERYIKRGMSEEETLEMINAFYAQMPAAIAANQHMGSTTTADPVLMRYVLRSLDKLGLVFLDSATTTKLVSPAVARELGIVSMIRDIFLDVPDNSDSTLVTKLKVLPRFSGRAEPIVIITHCHNRYKLEALQKFIAKVLEMGFELISLSDALKRLPTRPPA
ncbi:MAG: divergent polysaccharide deacetylase family protein [Candidatus Cloacimonetes bacterium]|nr:divergent polysaccharide deacetylase family protein [Candidatus Cloacimonadota bacterium]